MLFAFTGLAVVLAFVAVAVAAAIVCPDSYASLANGMLAGAVLATILTLLGSIGFFLYDVRQSRRIREIRTKIAVFMQSGHELVGACHTTARASTSPPDAEAWGEEAFNFLRDNLGPDFAVRFDSSAGLPMGTTTLMPPYSQVESFVKSRIARLAEIARGLGEGGR